MSQVNNNSSFFSGQILKSNKTIAIVSALAITSLACAIIIGCTCPINSFASSLCLSSMTTLSFCSLLALASIAIISIKQHSKQNQKLSSRSSSISSVTSTSSTEETCFTQNTTKATVCENQDKILSELCNSLASTYSGSPHVKFDTSAYLADILDSCKVNISNTNADTASKNIQKQPGFSCFNFLFCNDEFNGESKETALKQLLNHHNPINKQIFARLFPSTTKTNVFKISQEELKSLHSDLPTFQANIKCNFQALMARYGISVVIKRTNTTIIVSPFTIQNIDTTFIETCTSVLDTLKEAKLNEEAALLKNALIFIFSSIDNNKSSPSLYSNEIMINIRKALQRLHTS